MAGSTASARALLAGSPMASVDATATRELTIEWLKITAVPLLVFSIGACMWSCIKSTTAWRMLTADAGGSARNEAGEVSADSSRPVENDHDAGDLEAGLELSQVSRMDDDRHRSVGSKRTPLDGRLAARGARLPPTSEMSTGY